MKIKGKIKKIFASKQASEKFTIRNLWLETDGNYPQTIEIQFTQSSVTLLDNFRKGDEVEIGVNLRGREWTNPQGEVKVFNTIQGWSIYKIGAKVQSTLEEKAEGPSKGISPNTGFDMTGSDDDLPF